MSQQNMLLLILGIVIVGVAVAVFIGMMNTAPSFSTNSPFIVVSKSVANTPGRMVGNLNDNTTYKIKYELRTVGNFYETVYLYSNDNYEINDTLRFSKGN